MTEAPGQSNFLEVTNHHGAVAEEGNQDGRAQNGAVALHAEQVNRRADAEACGRQSYTAQRAQTDPQAPGHLVGEIRAGAEAFKESHIRGIETCDKYDGYDDAPECEL